MTSWPPILTSPSKGQVPENSNIGACSSGTLPLSVRDDWRVSYNREAVRPLVGTIWAWEPGNPDAAALIEVTRVTWNGEEWWVTAKTLADNDKFGGPKVGAEYPNDLARFWEAAYRVSKNHGPGGYHPDAVRRGAPLADEQAP